MPRDMKEHSRVAAETGFLIEGKLYPVPSLDTFSMDEAQILYDYSGLTLEDFVPPEGVTRDDPDFAEAVAKKVKNPGFQSALMHVTYQRANPRLTPQRVRALIGAANMVEALQHVDDSEAETDAVPPASTTEPAASSLRSSVDSSASFGDGLRAASDGLDVQDATTTTTKSGTSSISDLTSSAA